MTIPQVFPSTFTTTVGAGAAIMVGTTHGYGTDGDGMPAGAWEALAGDGTTHGDITVGAGPDITAGDTLTTDGAGLVLASDGVDTMAGVAIMVVIGTAHTTTEDTMAETTPTCQDGEAMLPVFQELH